jgi:glycosyltransferase involved in cell wall biosynthesis
VKLSILMPVYNEKQWFKEIANKVLSQQVAGIQGKELIIVDDHSDDGTTEIVEELAQEFPDEVITVLHEKNQGKGASIRSAVEKMTGDIAIVQDADLEYDPFEYNKLLKPILEGRADVVYGSRFVGSEEKRVLYFWHMIGNKFLTLLSNMLTNINLSDVETCYKVFKKEILEQVNIQENRFGFEPEITAKISKLNCRIYEIGISYYGRTYSQGKKIGWRDGVQTLWCILKYNMFWTPKKKKEA